MDILQILLGLGFAIYGAQFLVNGGVAIAKRFNIPDLVIGSTIVAFGTSMPELSVNIQSALAGNTDLALGNILGSNIFNICVIVGIVALITPIAIAANARAKDLPMCLMAAVVLVVCGNELYFDGIQYHELMPSHGIVFLCFFLIFAYYTYQEAAVGSAAVAAGGAASGGGSSGETSDAAQMGPIKAAAYIAVGLLGLVYGGDFIVEGASGVAKSFGLSDRVIGLLIVGPGTSFPELIASVVAALKKEVDMVIGNVLGSNIINILFTLGVTSLILPVPLDLELNTSVLFNIGVTLLLVLYAWFGRGRPIGRFLGVILIVSYVAYIANALGVF
ncbi:MAG: calcium/sodium antiporter [Gammaproteobacteria bacterium]|nr:calcium/sodium antiporter [Gammaproteobacteria bacterium]